VKLNWKHARLLLALAVILPCAGCGGITASRGVSPLDFLIPGGFLLQNDPQTSPTNNLVPPTQPYRQIALAK
jgi:hypothetical protein